MTRRLLALGLVATGLAPFAVAAERLPYSQIVDIVRALVAAQLGRRQADISTIDSLFSQGLSEGGLQRLVIAVEDEFGVVIPDEDIRQAKWNDSGKALSVRRLAEMIERQMQSPP